MKRNIFKVLTFILIIALLTISFTSISFAKDPSPSPQPPTIVPNGETNSYWVTRTTSDSNSTGSISLTLQVQYSMWTDRALSGRASYDVTVYPAYFLGDAYYTFSYGSYYRDGDVTLDTTMPMEGYHWQCSHDGSAGYASASLQALGMYLSL